MILGASAAAPLTRRGGVKHAYLPNSDPIQITRIAAVGWEHLEVRKQAVIGIHLLDTLIDAPVFLIKDVSSRYMAQVLHLAFYKDRYLTSDLTPAIPSSFKEREKDNLSSKLNLEDVVVTSRGEQVTCT